MWRFVELLHFLKSKWNVSSAFKQTCSLTLLIDLLKELDRNDKLAKGLRSFDMDWPIRIEDLLICCRPMWNVVNNKQIHKFTQTINGAFLKINGKESGISRWEWSWVSRYGCLIEFTVTPVIGIVFLQSSLITRFTTMRNSSKHTTKLHESGD